ncbi:hypothetical protein IWQ60_010539 [Tieghemiomyces parasiticus]|uniref:Uncharacterized protein n=1 Tax=Tieghemiomyces parasiticus TaxID=78921 RepID=A0A9W7ZJH8_9FUNG|nr:hypothetical protein IWQ60_010539 [Tieghemiomyces parasiticus]
MDDIEYLLVQAERQRIVQRSLWTNYGYSTERSGSLTSTVANGNLQLNSELLYYPSSTQLPSPPPSSTNENTDVDDPSESNFRWDDALFDYLDSNHANCFVAAIAASIQGRQDRPESISRFRLHLPLDVALLHDHHPALGQALLSYHGHLTPRVPDTEGRLFERCLRNACYNHLQRLLGNEVVLLPEQVDVVVSPEHLPLMPGCYYPSIRALMADQANRLHGQLVNVRGLVTRVWLPTGARTRRTWLCRNSNCRRREYCHYRPEGPEPRVIRRSCDKDYRITGYGARLLASDGRCGFCRTPMVEMFGDLAPRYTQRIWLRDVSTAGAVGNFTRTVEAVLPNHYVAQVQVGQILNVVASLEYLGEGAEAENGTRADAAGRTRRLHVWSYQLSSHAGPLHTRLTSRATSLITSDQLYAAIRHQLHDTLTLPFKMDPLAPPILDDFNLTVLLASLVSVTPQSPDQSIHVQILAPYHCHDRVAREVTTVSRLTRTGSWCPASSTMRFFDPLSTAVDSPAYLEGNADKGTNAIV